VLREAVERYLEKADSRLWRGTRPPAWPYRNRYSVSDAELRHEGAQER